MKHVMIADRDVQMFREVSEILQHNFKISTLPQDNDLQEHFQQNIIDMILLTVSTQDTSYFKTYEKLKNIPELKGKPVIFLAWNRDMELEQRALSLGAEDYLVLPITPELLLRRINNCLELEELRRERPYVEKYQDAISLSFAELVECRDVATGGHLKNTTIYFNILLQEALTSEFYKNVIPVEDTKDLLRSVTLHDIGKIGINDDVLRKEDTLDFNEFEYMKTHTTLGMQAFENVIKETGGVRWLFLAKDMAYCHHERWDGTGYPNGLKGEGIPFYARMLTVVDVYDALTSNRAYKKAFTHQNAVDIIMEGKGSLFDPDLVDLFVNAKDKFEEVLNNKCEIDLMERV